ncbi:tetratricopeptide repeat protein [Saccharopolyspora rosea]|uniref:Tetratricopeptide repeat protein n=1 Tax=Saccharopolyspora rosea TaxID=524884 RepID=A0ABW3FUJ2_9PSEU|nr:tetratricopeptide repeat protein [Saccharopolyspora rosea]
MNRFDGRAHSVVQAGQIGGDVHIHPPDQPKPPPQLVPPPTRVYTNNERQLAEIAEALRPGEDGDRHCPVVVVQGPPGGGKSATAYQWIDQHRGHYPDGLFYAPLAGAESGREGEILRDFLVAVGYRREEVPESYHARSDWFRSWTTGKRVAVVVDDAVTAAQVRALRPGFGGSALLVTAAAPLGALRVDETARFVELDPMSPESARLLLRRILGERDPRPGAEPEEFDALVGLCDGSTIALCVCGALLAQRPDWPVARLVRDLSREERRLAVLSRDEDLSVTSVLNTAVARLDERTRRLYAAFGQHPGSGDVGVEALVAALGEDADDVRDRLDELVDARLVQQTSDRYFVFGLVRDHSRTHCGGEAPGIRRRFEEFYLRGALAAGHAVRPGRGWLERLWPQLSLGDPPADPEAWLESERVALRALAARLAADGDVDACRLAVALWPYQDRAKHLDDMDAVNQDAADVAAAHDMPFARGLALVQRGFALRHRGDLDKAAEVLSDAVELARAHGPRDLEATAVESLGLVERELGKVDEARELLERNLAMAREIDDERRLALARMHLGSVAEASAAVELLDEAERSFAESEPENLAKTRLWRGMRRVELRQLDAARTDLDAALEHARSAKRGAFLEAQAWSALGEWAEAAGDRAAAAEHYGRAEAINRTWGFLPQAERVRARRDGLDG